MKIIFLDIDGVLATGGREGTINRHVEVEGHRFNPFYGPAVEQLNRVIRETEAEIVVSSSWRCDGHRWDALLFHFTGQGIEKRPIDRTPDGSSKFNGDIWVSCQRGDEIKAWLDAHASIDGFVAIDDDRDMDSIKDNFVWVEQGMFNGGFGPKHADQAIAILNRVA